MAERSVANTGWSAPAWVAAHAALGACGVLLVFALLAATGSGAPLLLIPAFGLVLGLVQVRAGAAAPRLPWVCASGVGWVAGLLMGGLVLFVAAARGDASVRGTSDAVGAGPGLVWVWVLGAGVLGAAQGAVARDARWAIGWAAASAAAGAAVGLLLQAWTRAWTWVGTYPLDAGPLLADAADLLRGVPEPVTAAAAAAVAGAVYGAATAAARPRAARTAPPAPVARGGAG